MLADLNPRFTFEAFVVGTANRLAVAAARRVGESPGASYNPLFIYSASGNGKTHLLGAIGNLSRRLHPDLSIAYDTLEHFMEDALRAIEEGRREEFASVAGAVGLLLLDDVQFLAGKHRTQEELLRVWDRLTTRGGQVVLTSDRPPQEIDGLDQRLHSRFSGGLIVDMGAPDFETRVAILRRKAEEQGQTLAAGVPEALARTAFSNVRELQGALNRILAIQDLESRTVGAEEAMALLAGTAGATVRPGTAAGEGGEDGSQEAQIARAVEFWRGEGYRARRLEGYAKGKPPAESLEGVLRGFESDVERLREIAGEIRTLDPAAPELAKEEILRDPDRLAEADALLAAVRERSRPLPIPPAEYTFDASELREELLAVRSARAVAREPGEARYNPLFIHGPEGSGKTTLLGAIGNEIKRRDPATPVAFVRGRAFAAEVIQALERNLVGPWRERYLTARILLLDDVDALAGTERAQEELFHIFEALHRSGAQLVFTAEGPPGGLAVEPRLRTRLGSGLVADLSEAAPPDAATDRKPQAAGRGRKRASRATAGAARGARAPAPSAAAAETARASAAPAAEAEEEVASRARLRGRARTRRVMATVPDPWFLDTEKLVWFWPYLEDWLVERTE